MIAVNIIDELKKIVGDSYVSTAPEDLYMYSFDMTESEPGKPDVIVLPYTTEEVQKIVMLANDAKIPIVPYVSAANIGGLTIPILLRTPW